MPGTLTRDQLVTEICDVVGKSGNAASVSGASLTSRVQTYLNWAQRRVARYWNWHELVARQDAAATVAGVKKYPMESGTNNLGLSRTKDIISVTLIDGANSRTLKRLSTKPYFKRFPYPENYAQARPWVYIRYGMNLEFFQIPDSIYTMQILWSQWPTDFSTGSQTSDFDYKDELLITAGVMETYLALEEYQDASTWMAKLKGQLEEAASVDMDSDMEWTALPFSLGPDIMSGTPWTEPGGAFSDPLYGYPD